MNEETRKRRAEKVRKTTIAAVEHLRNAAAALNDANLYSIENEEKIIDRELSVIESTINALNKDILGTEEVKKNAESFENFFRSRR